MISCFCMVSSDVKNPPVLLGEEKRVELIKSGGRYASRKMYERVYKLISNKK